MDLVLVAIGVAAIAPPLRDVITWLLERALWERERTNQRAIAYDRWEAWGGFDA